MKYDVIYAWIDEETTGLDPEKNDVITLSVMIEINGKIDKSINLKIQPHSWENIDDEALKVNGITREEMKTFDPPDIALDKLLTFFSKYVNKFDKKDKFYFAGYNVKKFDIPFLEQFFIKCGDDYFWSWFQPQKLDVFDAIHFFYMAGYFRDCENLKLSTIANKMDIPLNAHDAKSDIMATRAICYKLLDKIKKEK